MQDGAGHPILRGGCQSAAPRPVSAWRRGNNGNGRCLASPCRFIGNGSIRGSWSWPGPRPPNSPSSSKGAAQKCGPSPMVTDPSAFTHHQAPTVTPLSRIAEADPSRPSMFQWRHQSPPPQCQAQTLLVRRPAPCAPRGHRGCYPIACLHVRSAVKDNRTWHDGHALVAHRKTPPPGAQPIRHTRGSIQPKAEPRIG